MLAFINTVVATVVYLEGYSYIDIQDNGRWEDAGGEALRFYHSIKVFNCAQEFVYLVTWRGKMKSVFEISALELYLFNNLLKLDTHTFTMLCICNK